MLEQPEIKRLTVEAPELVPCFRCLFDKPISQFWCDPRTCDMMEQWLRDTVDGKLFVWREHEPQWVIKITMKILRDGEASER